MLRFAAEGESHWGDRRQFSRAGRTAKPDARSSHGNISAVCVNALAGILIAKPLVQEEGYVYTDRPGVGVVVLYW
jgi:hypothetical protein